MSDVTAPRETSTPPSSSYYLDHIFDPTGNMPQEKPERSTIGLTPAQVAGSALAAVSGALLASFAGTTGTIVGTAIGSVVATVGAALYTWSLRHTSAAVRRTAAQVRQTALPTGALPRPIIPGLVRSKDGKGSVAPADSSAPDVDGEAADVEEKSALRSLPWGKLAIASVGVTAVVLGGITAFEAITGQPVSSLVGGDDSQGTSVGNQFGGGSRSSKDDQQPKDKTTPPSDESSQAPDPDTDTPQAPVPGSTEVPTPEPSPAVPSGEPSGAPQGAPGAAPEGAPAAQPSTLP